QPVHYRYMFGAYGTALRNTCYTFVSAASLAAGLVEHLKTDKPLIAVKNTRDLRKKEMIHNGTTPKMEIDPETYEVRADGELLTCEPAHTLPLAQRYFLF